MSGINKFQQTKEVTGKTIDGKHHEPGSNGEHAESTDAIGENKNEKIPNLDIIEGKLLNQKKKALEETMNNYQTSNIEPIDQKSIKTHSYQNDFDTDQDELENVDLKIAEERIKNLEEQLVRAQKMESIGILAGGLAHDFNNFISCILGYAELLKMQVDKNISINPNAAQKIIDGAKKASELAGRLLGYSHHDEKDNVPIDVNNLVSDSLSISDRAFSGNVNIALDLEENIESVSGDKIQLEQVLTNLFINAKNSMPDGGELIIKTETVLLDILGKENCELNDLRSYAKISISDTGIGMEENILTQIFEPLYTTRHNGGGSGLGLAVVKKLIEDHDGMVKVKSSPGQGSTFIVYLPTT